MVKKITYAFLAIFLLLTIVGIFGIRHFNNLWFKETPNYLIYSSEAKPMDFRWSSNTYGDYFEPHEAMLIPVQMAGIVNPLYFQFDTGAPTTLIYGNTLKSLGEAGIDVAEIAKGDRRYVQSLDFVLGGNNTSAAMIQILENYGNPIDQSDTTRALKIGTIGADFMDQRITLIDFKNEVIQIYNERPHWMSSLSGFQAFAFDGRRFMLPTQIAGKELELFYDSGCSAFGLITSKKRFDDYTDEKEKEVKYEGKRFGESLTIHHKSSNETMEIGHATLPLKRISYVDIYADYQRFMTPFTRIGGWLGNKPFTESTLILDTKKEEFIVIESTDNYQKQ